MSGGFAADFVRVLDLDVPPIAEPVLTALKQVEFLDREMADVFRLATDEYLHLEFQDGSDPPTLRRFLLYDAMLLERDGRRVHTAVVYTGAVNVAPDAFDGGSLIYRVRNVYLRRYDGEGTLRELRPKVDGGRRLTRADAVRLALIPLMRLGALTMDAAVLGSLELLRGFEGGRERATLAGAIIGLCDRFLSDEARGRLLAMARSTTAFDELLADMVAKGKAEGKAEAIVREGRHDQLPSVNGGSIEQASTCTRRLQGRSHEDVRGDHRPRQTAHFCC